MGSVHPFLRTHTPQPRMKTCILIALFCCIVVVSTHSLHSVENQKTELLSRTTRQACNSQMCKDCRGDCDSCNMCPLCNLCFGSTSPPCDKCKFCKGRGEEAINSCKKKCQKGKQDAKCQPCSAC